MEKYGVYKILKNLLMILVSNASIDSTLHIMFCRLVAGFNKIIWKNTFLIKVEILVTALASGK